jgi:DNA-binding MarR family transcriptional regulator
MANHDSLDPSLASRNYRLIHDIYVLLDAGDRCVLEPYQLTNAQFRILSLLASKPIWRLTDLSQAMLCARSTITRVVDGLESSGWVRRTTPSDDRRSQHVHLTPPGLELLTSAHEAHLRSLEIRLGALDSQIQDHLATLLQSLYAQLSETLDKLPEVSQKSYANHSE